MRIIDKHTAFSMNLESIITSHDANVYPVWLCLLSEIKILERFLKDRLLRICDTNLGYDWGFSRWKYDVEMKTQLIVPFSSTKHYD